MSTAVTGVVLMRGLQWKPNRGDEVSQQADRDHRKNGAFGYVILRFCAFGQDSRPGSGT